MNLTIRKADIEDAAAIAHVQVESWKTTYTGIVSDAFLGSLNQEDRMRSWQVQTLAGNVTIFVAEDEGEIFGFAAGGEARENLDKYDAELYAICDAAKESPEKTPLEKLAGKKNPMSLKAAILRALLRIEQKM